MVVLARVGAVTPGGRGARLRQMNDVSRSRWLELAPPDPVIEAFKKDVDRTLLRENLKLTPDERVRKLADFMRSLEEVHAAGPAAGR